MLLYPFYVHGERPMVLSVSPVSPLSGYLSYGDIIVSLDGSDIYNPREWVEKMTHLDIQMLNQSYHSSYPKISQTVSGGKGYCVPSFWVDEERAFQSMYDEISCPDDLTAFVSIPCCTSHLLDGESCNDSCRNTTRRNYCFPPKDIIKFKKCGDGWQTLKTAQSCQCLQDECCLTPVQNRGVIWVEVAFSRPHSKCLKDGRNATAMDVKSFVSGSAACLETFVFIGDTVSIVNSIKLSAYRPRWESGTFGAYLPNFLEKVLVSMFRVSASLALLNSMPVFLLDGESILEVGLCYITWLGPRIRHQVVRLLLSGGSLLFAIALSRAFFFIFVSHS
uniref:Membrane-bound transcription factor site-2 protease n=2 Tax=Anthurium amnicola TaxID=1678845 RepID=A0A1D1XKR9_9ARAE